MLALPHRPHEPLDLAVTHHLAVRKRCDVEEVSHVVLGEPLVQEREAVAPGVHDDGVRSDLRLR